MIFKIAMLLSLFFFTTKAFSSLNQNGLPEFDISTLEHIQRTTQQSSCLTIFLHATELEKNQETIYGTVATTVSNAVSRALQAGDLVINASVIGATVSDGLSFANADASAIAIANAINTTGTDADVHATVNPTVTNVSYFSASANSGGHLVINGQTTSSISITTDLNLNVTNAVAAINALTNETGVVASADAEGKLVFTAQDGRNITVAYSGEIENTDLGAVDAGTTSGTIILTSSNPITIGGDHPEYVGLTGGTTLTHLGIDRKATVLANITKTQNILSELSSDLDAAQKYLESTLRNYSKFQNMLSRKSTAY